MRALSEDAVLEQELGLEAVGELAGGTAHDLNNLLAIILNYAGFARDAAPADSPIRDDLDEVLKAAHGAAELIRRLRLVRRGDVPEPRIAAANGAIEGGPERGRGERILVVDDYTGVGQLAVRFLEAAGYDVEAVTSGEEALARVEAVGPPDLLLTDIVMPGMSGVALAGRLHSRYPGMPVAYMSGYAGDAISRHGIPEGEAVLIEKPFAGNELLDTVRVALAAA